MHVSSEKCKALFEALRILYVLAQEPLECGSPAGLPMLRRSTAIASFVRCLLNLFYRRAEAVFDGGGSWRDAADRQKGVEQQLGKVGSRTDFLLVFSCHCATVLTTAARSLTSPENVAVGLLFVQGPSPPPWICIPGDEKHTFIPLFQFGNIAEQLQRLLGAQDTKS
jgi:hypothetical protein